MYLCVYALRHLFCPGADMTNIIHQVNGFLVIIPKSPASYYCGVYKEQLRNIKQLPEFHHFLMLQGKKVNYFTFEFDTLLQG